ncbi:MAG: hypothetical protein GX591_18700 [Planctomycetes bacterium]|nr:hypothetical protein [Planctomycetota bacterium]
MRFGPALEQVISYTGILGIVWSATFLLGLAEFLSGAFGLPVDTVVLFAGVVVVFYSVLGGSWSAQITDSLQAFLILAIAIVVAVLGIRSIGGMGGLFSAIHEAGLAEDYRIVKEVGHTYTSSAAKVMAGNYTVPWMFAQFLYAFILSANMTGCHRFLSTKDDGSARKAALLAAILAVAGAFIWYTPGMVARLKYEKEVMSISGIVLPDRPRLTAEETSDPAAAQAVAAYEQAQAEAIKQAKASGKLKGNPADKAYAVVAKELLPPGLLGLVVVSMFAATMAAMDGNLTGTAGIITKNIYPPLVRLLGGRPWEGRALLALTKIVNLSLGIAIIGLAYLIHHGAGSSSIYDIGLKIISFISAPTALPFALSFFVPTLPRWAPLVGIIAGLINSALMNWGVWLGDTLLAPSLADYSQWAGGLMWYQQLLLNTAIAVLSTGAMVIFWSPFDEPYVKQVEEFFRKIRTPVDFKKEHGEDSDHSLLKVVGGLGLIMAGAVAVLVFFAPDWTGRFSVLFIVAFVGGISGLMYYFGRRGARRQIPAAIPASSQEPPAAAS